MPLIWLPRLFSGLVTGIGGNHPLPPGNARTPLQLFIPIQLDFLQTIYHKTTYRP